MTKSLLPIMNKPMISYLVESLPKQVNKVILAVNYRKNQLEDYFNNNDFGKEIIINDEPEPLGTGGAVKFAEKHLSDRFFVLNSDIICSIDLSKMIKFHIDNNSSSTISLWPVENVSEFGVADVKNNGNITRFVEKPKPKDAPSNLINAGAYLLEPFVLDYIETGRLISMEKEIFPQIINDTGKFYGYQIQEYWMDIGRIRSYMDVHDFLLKKGNLKNYIGKNCINHGMVNNSVLGDNITLGNNSEIFSSIILNNVNIKDNTIIRNCVIGEDSIIGAYSNLQNSVIGDNETLDQNSIYDNQAVWTQSIPEGYPKKQIGNIIGE